MVHFSAYSYLPIGKDYTYRLVRRQETLYTPGFHTEPQEATISTRDQFLSTALRQFADRGFYGTSIAQIARELGLTKQALLHHFGSKERLYGEVLQSISTEMMQKTRALTEAHSTAASQLEELLVAQYQEQMNNVDSARLIMRELLDNEQRAARAENWYLKPYLDQLVALVKESDKALDHAEAIALVYQLLGAAHYFAISQPTLGNIFGMKSLKGAKKVYESQLRKLIQARLSTVR